MRNGEQVQVRMEGRIVDPDVHPHGDQQAIRRRFLFQIPGGEYSTDYRDTEHLKDVIEEHLGHRPPGELYALDETNVREDFTVAGVDLPEPDDKVILEVAFVEVVETPSPETTVRAILQGEKFECPQCGEVNEVDHTVDPSQVNGVMIEVDCCDWSREYAPSQFDTTVGGPTVETVTPTFDVEETGDQGADMGSDCPVDDCVGVEIKDEDDLYSHMISEHGWWSDDLIEEVL